MKLVTYERHNIRPVPGLHRCASVNFICINNIQTSLGLVNFKSTDGWMDGSMDDLFYVIPLQLNSY